MKYKAYKLFLSFIFFFALMLSFITNVEAKSVNNSTTREEICLVDKIEKGANGTEYSIYNIYPSVKTGLLVSSDMTGGTTPKECFCTNFDGVCEESEGKCVNDNLFSSQSTGNYCAITSVDPVNGTYEYTLCSKTEDYADAVQAIKETYTLTNIGNSYILSMSLPSEYSSFAGKINVKVCYNENCENDALNSDSPIPSNFDVVNNLVNGSFSVNIPLGRTFYVVFTGQTSAECTDTNLGYFQSVTPNMVKNTEYNGNVCTQLRAKYPNKDDSWVTAFLPECYEEELSTEELQAFTANINSQWETVQSILNSQSSSSSVNTNNLNCQFDANANKTNSPVATYTTTIYNGKYWTAVCTENMYLEYDTPKAVAAGMGFNYEVKVRIERTCRPVQVSKAKKKPKCQYAPECWGGPLHDDGIDNAGPTEEFDSCINTCDGGKYTQSCINTCYNKIYNNTDKTSDIINNNEFKISYNFDDYSLTPVASTKTYKEVNSECNKDLVGTRIMNTCYRMKWKGGDYIRIPSSSIISSNCVFHGNNNSRFYSSAMKGCATHCETPSKNDRYCYSEHGLKIWFNNTCNERDFGDAAYCFEVYKTSPNCSIDPETEYQQEVQKAHSEYLDVISLISKVDQNTKNKEIYSMSITEKYNDGKQSTTVFDNTGGNSKIYSKETNNTANIQSNNDGTMVSIGKDIGTKLTQEELSWIQVGVSTSSYTVVRNIDLKVGSAYIKKNGTFTTEKCVLPYSKSVIYNNTNELTDKTKDKDASLYGPYNQYFTSFVSLEKYNDPSTWPYYNSNVPMTKSTNEYEKNISIDLKNMGTWNQWGNVSKKQNPVNVKCFYGTGLGGILSNYGGIQYIFRPISLEDVFPNDRDPRFNWTGTAIGSTTTGAAQQASESLYGSVVSPDVLTESIQSKGETIYDESSGEVDYEFILTRQNIKNIKEYNKSVKDINKDGSRNYLDYDMDCYNKNGREICTSNFLDDTRYVTYGSGFTIDSRKAIAGCNNSKGGQCDLSPHTAKGGAQ